jgi:hypothetical protein
MSEKSTIINYNYFFITKDDFQKLIQSKDFQSNLLFGNKENDLMQNSNNINLNKENTIINYKNIIINENKEIKEKEITANNSENGTKMPTNLPLQANIKDDLIVDLTDKNQIKNNRFFIQKKRKLGRKPHMSDNICYHTKYSHDNILRKIKAKFFKKIINFINSRIISTNSSIKNTLKPLNGKISQNNNISFNLNLLNTKLKDIILNFPMNKKFKMIDDNYNKNIINSIYQEKVTGLIDVLEMTFLDIFKIFRDLKETEKLAGLDKYDSVIRELQKKGEDDEYIKKLEKTIMKFETYYFKEKKK